METRLRLSGFPGGRFLLRPLGLPIEKPPLKCYNKPNTTAERMREMKDKLLSLLQQNARLTEEELAAMLGLL